MWGEQNDQNLQSDQIGSRTCQQTCDTAAHSEGSQGTGLADRCIFDLAETDDEQVGTGESDLPLFQGALENYRAETLHWAEVRSAAMPAPKAPSRPRRLYAAAWALAPAMLVACVTTTAIRLHHAPGQAALAEAAGAPSAQILAEDESLLQSVDAALDGPDAIPTEQDLGLAETVDGTHPPRHMNEVDN